MLNIIPFLACYDGSMATKPETVDHILAQLMGLDVRARKMFGEYALYCDEKVVALICDDILFVKPTDAAQNFTDDSTLAPPYPGAKNYYAVADDKLSSSEWLTDFIRE